MRLKKKGANGNVISLCCRWRERLFFIIVLTHLFAVFFSNKVRFNEAHFWKGRKGGREGYWGGVRGGVSVGQNPIYKREEEKWCLEKKRKVTHRPKKNLLKGAMNKRQTLTQPNRRWPDPQKSWADVFWHQVYPTTSDGMQNGSSVRMLTHCIHVFCTFGANLYAQLVLINKMSALELRRRFIKIALLVG